MNSLDKIKEQGLSDKRKVILFITDKAFLYVMYNEKVYNFKRNLLDMFFMFEKNPKEWVRLRRYIMHYIQDKHEHNITVHNIKTLEVNDEIENVYIDGEKIY
ncbi:hypothetical protein RKS58_07080 [Lysinibacillus capsici]|uniref:hypothetical protein n=1 Tax=Lysinibacillus capsici TaxID=2115968 RepID=UPI0028BDE2C2|nr:hypothetical protein [Lysinibacillus capsici]WNN77599.1 hypothetical protein RKS58_07080 [Lysinibacillus capsici]